MECHTKKEVYKLTNLYSPVWQEREKSAHWCVGAPCIAPLRISIEFPNPDADHTKRSVEELEQLQVHQPQKPL